MQTFVLISHYKSQSKTSITMTSLVIPTQICSIYGSIPALDGMFILTLLSTLGIAMLKTLEYPQDLEEVLSELVGRISDISDE
jgi:hypothetical protein